MKNSKKIKYKTQKIKYRTTISFSNSTGHFSEKNQNTNLDTPINIGALLHINCSIIYNGQDMEAD